MFLVHAKGRVLAGREVLQALSWHKLRTLTLVDHKVTTFSATLATVTSQYSSINRKVANSTIVDVDIVQLARIATADFYVRRPNKYCVPL
jgi:hypothetical protein